MENLPPNWLGFLGTAYLFQLPVFLIWLVGGGLAIKRWERHPRVSLLTLVAVALFLAGPLFSLAFGLWLPRAIIGSLGGRIGSDNVRSVYSATIFLNNMVSAVPWGLLLIALFHWRSAQGRVAGTAARDVG